jgi:hypothetical protein
MVAALHSYTHPTWLRLWGFGSLLELNYVTTTIYRIKLDDLLFLKAIRQGRREDVKWHGVHLLWE